MQKLLTLIILLKKKKKNSNWLQILDHLYRVLINEGFGSEKMHYLKEDSHLPKILFTIFSDSPSKMMKNAFHFILKAPFVFKIFCSLSFWSDKKTACSEK